MKHWLKELEQLECLRSEDTPAAYDYPYYWVLLDPKSKENKIKVINWRNLRILQQTLHATHLLKLVDKMCKDEIDLTSIVEDIERTRFCPQTDRWADGQTDGRMHN